MIPKNLSYRPPLAYSLMTTDHLNIEVGRGQADAQAILVRHKDRVVEARLEEGVVETSSASKLLQSCIFLTWLRYGRVSCLPVTLVTTSSQLEKNLRRPRVRWRWLDLSHLLLSSSTKSLVPICRGLWVAWRKGGFDCRSQHAFPEHEPAGHAGRSCASWSPSA